MFGNETPEHVSNSLNVQYDGIKIVLVDRISSEKEPAKKAAPKNKVVGGGGKLKNEMDIYRDGRNVAKTGKDITKQLLDVNQHAITLAGTCSSSGGAQISQYIL